MSLWTAEQSAAIIAVRDACHVARRVQSDLENVRRVTKDDRSPVTVADFAVQAVVALRLQNELDEVDIVGEEHAQMLRKDEQKTVRNAVIHAVRSAVSDASDDEVLDAIDACDHEADGDAYWALDPVDGTKGFLRGQQYAIALAKIEDGKVVFGVMGCPNLPQNFTAPLDRPDPDGGLYAANLGGGAFRLDMKNPLNESTPIAALDAPPSTGIRSCESVESAHSSHSASSRILDLVGESGDPVRLDSQCKYVVVARGQADAYLRLPTKPGYREKIWDHAAGMLIAEEAGAIVSDATGEPLDYTQGIRLEHNRGIICAVRSVHSRIIDAAREIGVAVGA